MLNQPELLEGKVLLIDKPLEWSSFKVIGKLRSIFKIKKIGHAGTLDPLAIGLLIVCTGKFTKKINEYMGMEKEYTGTITLGSTTETYDIESLPTNHKSITHLTHEEIINTTKQFIGNILQKPPAHSAIKVDGVRLYALARQGLEVKLEPRAVTIYSFEITKINKAKVDFKVVCSTGTYIRSLANDFGEALGCGGHLSKLVRTRIGEFKLEDAYSIETIQADFDIASLPLKKIRY